MILVLGSSSTTQQALDALLLVKPQAVFKRDAIPRSQYFDPLDKTLTILDLDANGLVQTYLNASRLANVLHSKALFDHVDTVRLLVSDMMPSKPMLAYATELSQEILKRKPDATIDVLVLAELFDATLIEPPQADSTEWTIYSRSESAVAALKIPRDENSPYEQGNFEFYRQHISRVLFKGPLEARLALPQYKILAETVRNTYGFGSQPT